MKSSKTVAPISTGEAAPGLKDVARLAGVSPATVSRAVNQPNLLDTDTLRRVQEAVRKLRYVPNAQARALRSKRTYAIGAVVPTFDYAFYATTTSALENSIEERGYALFLASHHFDPKKEVRLTRALIERGVEAFMFVGLDHDPELFVMLEEHKRPYVLTWALDRTERHPSIGIDTEAAAFELAEGLIAMGHKRFGLITAPHAGNDLARSRTAGVMSAMRKHGLPKTSCRIEFARISVQSGAEAMEKLLALSARPSAVIGTNDALAVGARMACRTAGLKVPEDVSITGAGNSELGRSQDPPMTGVGVPVAEIGQAAATYLMGCLEGGTVQRLREFDFSVLWRGSTAPPTKPSKKDGRNARPSTDD